MNISERLKALRALMQQNQIDAYIVTSSDPHMSEYVPIRWTSRQWISGFTGSAGMVIITNDTAGLWTDSRYFIQAAKQLENSGIDLYKMGIENTPPPFNWLANQLSADATIGFDGSCFSVAQTRELKQSLGNLNIHIIDEFDLIDEIWKNRPSLPNNPIFDLNIKYTGKSRLEKLTELRKIMKFNDSNYHFVGSLDDIAWIFNVRGSDVTYTPLALSYAVIGEKSAKLYLNINQLSSDLINELEKDNIYISDYEQIFSDLDELPRSANILLDISRTNLKTFNSITANIIEKENPSQLLKSIKNDTEIEGIKNAMKKDGVALTHFFYWLEQNIEKEEMTELSLMNKVYQFRSEQDAFKDESFGTICGYRAHGAEPHYSTTKESDVKIKKEGILLIDSGAQYINGTTDITRTIPFGELNEEEKTDFTLVLKGMMQLAMAKFPQGTRGCNIDTLARMDLWKHGRNYGHGTGHGVGCFLNVHEGPQSIRQELKEQAILPGMVTSNEPALYRPGRYGIRHENLILCKEAESTPFGNFLEFETITLCHFETKGVIIEMLTPEEKNWLNNYHQKVYDILSPDLDEKHKNWLKEKTKAI